jgi:hypothetical protein
MKFKKGQSGNPKGRPKGAKDKATADLRERVGQLLDDEFDQIKADLSELSPKERVNAWIKLLDFTLPRLQRVEQNLTNDGQVRYEDVKDGLKFLYTIEDE